MTPQEIEDGICQVIDSFFFSSRRRHTRCALVTGFRRVLFRSCVAVPSNASVAAATIPNLRMKSPLFDCAIVARQAEEGKRGVKDAGFGEIGRASCRERVCQYV